MIHICLRSIGKMSPWPQGAPFQQCPIEGLKMGYYKSGECEGLRVPSIGLGAARLSTPPRGPIHTLSQFLAHQIKEGEAGGKASKECKETPETIEKKTLTPEPSTQNYSHPNP